MNVLSRAGECTDAKVTTNGLAPTEATSGSASFPLPASSMSAPQQKTPADGHFRALQHLERQLRRRRQRGDALNGHRQSLPTSTPRWASPGAAASRRPYSYDTDDTELISATSTRCSCRSSRRIRRMPAATRTRTKATGRTLAPTRTRAPGLKPARRPTAHDLQQLRQHAHRRAHHRANARQNWRPPLRRRPCRTRTAQITAMQHATASTRTSTSPNSNT